MNQPLVPLRENKTTGASVRRLSAGEACGATCKQPVSVLLANGFIWRANEVQRGRLAMWQSGQIKAVYWSCLLVGFAKMCQRWGHYCGTRYRTNTATLRHQTCLACTEDGAITWFKRSVVCFCCLVVYLLVFTALSEIGAGVLLEWTDKGNLILRVRTP